MKHEIRQIDNIYIGCGPDVRKGYVGCDVRKLDNVEIVCPAWELSKHVCGIKNIYTRHMVEHLTFSQFKAALKDWFKAMSPGGELYIVCPDLDAHMKQLQNAEITPEALKEEWSECHWALCSIFGWQREDYFNSPIETRYWDVHKSGYNAKLMQIFLQEAGFVNIKTISGVNRVHLKGICNKPL